MQARNGGKHLQTNFYKADTGAYGQQSAVPRTAGQWAQILESTPGIQSAQPLPLSGVFEELGVTHVYSGLLSLRANPLLRHPQLPPWYTLARRDQYALAQREPVQHTLHPLPLGSS